MTLEEHMFLSKYLFEKTVDTKKMLHHPLATHELQGYDKLGKERRDFYENFAYVLNRGLKINFNVPF